MNERRNGIVLRVTLVAILLAVPIAAIASVQLSPIMRSWRAEQYRLDANLAEASNPDPAALRVSMYLFIKDAQQVADQIGGSTAAIRDLRDRFQGLANDARRASGAAAQPIAFREAFTQVKADCASCHAIYLN